MRWVLVALCSVAASGCGDDVGASGGAGGGGNGGAGADAGVDAMPAEFGLDQRPQNPSCLAPARPTTSTQISLQHVFGNLRFNTAVNLLQAPGDGSRFFVVQKGGVVKVFANDDNVATAQTFVDITARVNSGPNEAGLLGM